MSKIRLFIGALAKNGSFAFAEGLALSVGANANVPFVRLPKNFKIFCAVGKKIKHRRVGKECRLARCPNVVSFLCRWSPVKMVYFFLVYSCLFVVALSSFTLAYNILICALLRDICRMKMYHAMRIFCSIGVCHALRIVRFRAKAAYCVHY